MKNTCQELFCGFPLKFHLVGVFALLSGKPHFLLCYWFIVDMCIYSIMTVRTIILVYYAVIF
nr:MAG TPA: hypothetical protein [Caudoviricetes sp.]